jgi:hypothetical protein
MEHNSEEEKKDMQMSLLSPGCKIQRPNLNKYLENEDISNPIKPEESFDKGSDFHSVDS